MSRDAPGTHVPLDPKVSPLARALWATAPGPWPAALALLLILESNMHIFNACGLFLTCYGLTFNSGFSVPGWNMSNRPIRGC